LGNLFLAHSLVSLDEDELLAQRRAAQAQIATAEASMRNAGVQYSRERQVPRSNNMMDHHACESHVSVLRWR
jgi:multidrug resistance efflux pump